jgi:prepilin-type N-terminal cleavage/methylation domain-containing protein
MFNTRGFTLIELMVTASILSVLIGIAVPNLTSFLIKMRVDNEIYQLSRLLQITRNTAVNEKKTVTLCPLTSDNNCSSLWQRSLTVFTDTNANKIYEPLLDERIVFSKAAINIDDKLHYGVGRNGIIFSPTGRLAGWGNNGSFRYCPKNHRQNNRGIRVAVSGRIYISADRNNDGEEEFRTTANIRCRD